MDPVCPFMTECRIGQSMLQGAVTRQQEEPFTVCIEAPRGVNVRWKRSEVRKGSMIPFAGELGEDAVGLVEEVR